MKYLQKFENFLEPAKVPVEKPVENTEEVKSVEEPLEETAKTEDPEEKRRKDANMPTGGTQIG